MRSGVLAFILVLASLSLASAGEALRIATWNMANLYAREGVALRPDAAERSAHDFAALRAYAQDLKADVIALQEVNSAAAVHKVFPKESYDVAIDGRRAADIAAGRRPPAEGGWGESETDGIYTAFAFRRGAVEVLEVKDVSELGIPHEGRDGVARPVRWGLTALVRFNGQRFRLLNVHLKSGCHTGRVRESSRDGDCVTLARQIPILETWMERRHAEGVPVIVLGDMNRKIERFRDKDDLWRDLDDGAPADLERLPARPGRGRYEDWLENDWEGCPTFHARDHGPIDYLFFDERAWKFVDRTSYRYVLYSTDDAAEHGERLSDHCPASVDLVVPPRR